MDQFKKLSKLLKYLESNGHSSELSALGGLIKTASKKDAKYLMGMNLRALRKDMPKKDGEDPREYYSMLTEMAKKGPYFSEDALNFIRDKIEDSFIDVNRKEFIKWLGDSLSSLNTSDYPTANEVSMVKDWIVGTGWPEDGMWAEDTELSSYNLNLAIITARDWHDEASGPIIRGREVEKTVMYTGANGIKIVYEPTAEEDPIARINLGKKLGLCLAHGMYSNDRSGRIYSVRSPGGKPGACIRIQNNKVHEVKGPGNKPSSITIPNTIVIKEWFKKEKFDPSGMGKSDFEALPPTTWDDALEVWNKSPDKFLERGWFRAYRKKFLPHMEKLLENMELNFGQSTDLHLVKKALRGGAHHIYAREFSHHLETIAKLAPAEYLRSNLPKTYSSKIYDKYHNFAADAMAAEHPSDLLYFTSGTGRSDHDQAVGSPFSDDILKMLRARTKDAMTTLLKYVEDERFVDKLVSPLSSEYGMNLGGGRFGADEPLISVFRNKYALTTFPKIAEDILAALDAAYANADFRLDEKAAKSRRQQSSPAPDGSWAEIEQELDQDEEEELERLRNDYDDWGGYDEYDEPMSGRDRQKRVPKSVSGNYKIIKELIKNRGYRHSPMFKKVTDEAVSNLLSDAEAAPRFDRWDDAQAQTANSMSFFELGLHNAKEYRHLTPYYAELAIKKLEEVSLGPNDSYWGYGDGEDRLLKLKSVPEDLKRRIIRKKLDLLGPTRYLYKASIWKRVEYADVTEEAINRLPVMKLFYSDDNSLDSISGKELRGVWDMPRIIRNTEGIISPDLTAKMRESIYRGSFTSRRIKE